MTVKLSRRAALAALAGAGALMAAPGAWADPEAEAFVAKNAPLALAALNDSSLTTQGRQAKFIGLFEQFADVEEIALFVLGPYAAKLREDKALHAEWMRVFRDYSMAVYQDQLDQYRGDAIKIAGKSYSRVYGGAPHYFVSTDVVGARTVRLQWRLIKDKSGGFRVIDVQLKDGSNSIWLAQQQKRFFEAFLGGKQGDLKALIADVLAQTERMRKRILARENARKS